MIISVNRSMTVIYDTLGYGCFTIALKAGTQTVDAKFGQFLLDHYDGVTSDEGLVLPPDNSELQAQIADLTAQLAALTSAQSTPGTKLTKKQKDLGITVVVDESGAESFIIPDGRSFATVVEAVAALTVEQS